MIVDPDRLTDAPEAFQLYVQKYFVKKPLLGREVLVAATSFLSGSLCGRGFAPSHTLDLRRFTEGLPAGQDLSSWMTHAEGQFFWRFYSSDTGMCCLED